MEFSGNSVQPQGKLTLRSRCNLGQAIHMQPSVSGARKLLIEQYGTTGYCYLHE